MVLGVWDSVSFGGFGVCGEGLGFRRLGFRRWFRALGFVVWGWRSGLCRVPWKGSVGRHRAPKP